MNLKTTVFQEACKTILMAVDSSAANLELITKDTFLYLNVTNKEYYVSIKYELEKPETFHAVVNASLFLNLISGITTETFDLNIKDNTVVLKSGKSNYKVAMIYENDTLMSLPVIDIQNKTVEMSISNDILKSIVNINSKELLKVKNLDVNPLQKYYYIDETGCFTFTTGACLNSFTLEKPIKLLLNDKTVKLFKLFKDDVSFSFGFDANMNNELQAKAIFETADTYLAIIVPNDEIMLSKIQGPCLATKQYISENYAIKAVLSVNTLSAAIARLMLFTKNSIDKINMMAIHATVSITADELSITDKLGNTEVVQIENGSYIEAPYNMVINLADLKLVLDSCKDEHITLNCGNHVSVVLTRGLVSNLIPESKPTTV